MKATVSTDLLLRFLQATPEQQAAIERILQCGAPSPAGPVQSGVGGTAKTEAGERKCEEEGGRYVFRQAGSHWDVVFGGGDVFHVKDNLGARYLDYLLHRPNGVICAYDLEVTIRPEKGRARSRDSIQEKLDGEGVRRYLRELARLRAERDEAASDGELTQAERLDREIGALEEALQSGGATGDAGERARGNVRKAISGVRRELAKGGPAERNFAQHIEQFVSTGYECVYNQPEGRVWE